MVLPPVTFTGFAADISIPVEGVSNFMLFSRHIIVMESATVTDKFLPALILESFTLVIEIWSLLFTVTLPPLILLYMLSYIVTTICPLCKSITITHPYSFI